jgi:organic radical activating enzyme
MNINLSRAISDDFCIAPWVNLHISQQNQIKPCCGGKGEFEFIENYVNGTNSSLSQLKQDLVDGKSPSYCAGCMEREWYSEFLDQDLSVDNINSFTLKSIDARWGNTCQLSCMYCNEKWSSTWAGLKSKIIPIQSSRIYNNNIDKIFDLIKSNQHQIKRVSMLGGEPLLLKENLRLLNSIANDTSVEIFTNLNVDVETNKIYQQLIKRTNVNWYVSMETIEKRFEFVRRGANWNKQLKNLQLLSYSCPQSITFQSQYCVYNALHLVELYDFANTFEHIHVGLTLGITNPEMLNFFLFPESFKVSALDEINRCINKYPNASNQLIPIKKQLESTLFTSRPNIVEDCITWHQAQESKYFNNQYNFLELWPEYSAK